MKLRVTALAATALGALALAACGNNNPNTTADNATATSPAAGVTPQGEPPKATETNTAADQGSIDFIQKAAMSDMYEIEASKLVVTKTKSAGIKSFAQMMIDAHTATTEAVKPIASRLQVSPPMQLDPEHQGMIDDLTKASAKDFDKKYLDQQTSAHNKALDLMKSEADNGQDAELKQFAAATLPKVQEHLDKAKALDKGGADEAKKTTKPS